LSSGHIHNVYKPLLNSECMAFRRLRTTLASLLVGTALFGVGCKNDISTEPVEAVTQMVSAVTPEVEPQTESEALPVIEQTPLERYLTESEAFDQTLYEKFGLERGASAPAKGMGMENTFFYVFFMVHGGDQVPPPEMRRKFTKCHMGMYRKMESLFLEGRLSAVYNEGDMKDVESGSIHFRVGKTKEDSGEYHDLRTFTDRQLGKLMYLRFGMPLRKPGGLNLLAPAYGKDMFFSGWEEWNVNDGANEFPTLRDEYKALYDATVAGNFNPHSEEGREVLSVLEARYDDYFERELRGRTKFVYDNSTSNALQLFSDKPDLPRGYAASAGGLHMYIVDDFGSFMHYVRAGHEEHPNVVAYQCLPDAKFKELTGRDINQVRIWEGPILQAAQTSE
jgi:hypothetical protein